MRVKTKSVYLQRKENIQISWKSLFSLCFFWFILTACNSHNNNMLIKTNRYEIYSDKVVEGEFTATVISRNEIISDYKSKSINSVGSLVTFKFSINQKDNELPFGVNHLINFSNKQSGYKTIEVFGKPSADTTGSSKALLPVNFEWTVQLDLRKMFQDFETTGYYVLSNGEKLFKKDFKNVYIAGGTAPLTWDFVNLYQNKQWELTDPDGDHIYQTTIILNPKTEQADSRTWKLQSDISAYPVCQTDYPIVDALYNLTLDELVLNIEADSTFRTGKEWPGVWTRDISYSTILALAVIEPEIAMISLKKKVKNGRIIQDTGTGGSWPVSTDRTVWIIAAWEIYKVTGDKDWLEYIYEITKNTLTDDLKVIRDTATGLMFGESSFLDWREQTYPHWMNPIDIFMSRCLGTNAVHFEAYTIAGEMADILGKSSVSFKQIANQIKEGINKYLWLDDNGYYSQYLYGRLYPQKSSRSEALGESLSILFGIADSSKANRIASNTPITDYGIPCIYPQIPGIAPYHNDAVWPFVEAFWALASAKAGNPTAVDHSVAAIYRQSALFLTNKENMVATTGDYYGTAVNSDRQLWSVAANLAITYRLYFGLDFITEGIRISPFIPEYLKGEKILTGFRYRNASLNFRITGTGNRIDYITLNGLRLSNNIIPAAVEGQQEIVIKMASYDLQPQEINLQKVTYSPKVPRVNLDNISLSDNLIVNVNGQQKKDLTSLQSLKDSTSKTFEISAATKDNNLMSFLTQPVIINKHKVSNIIEIENSANNENTQAQGYTGKGYIEITKKKNIRVTRQFSVDQEGLYSIDFRYVNATGPVNTDNNCAIRTLFIDGKEIGAIIFPQGGLDEYSNWQYSNHYKINLKKGSHTMELKWMPYNENMDGEINNAFIDHLRLITL